MAKYYRANNKRGYLYAHIVPNDLQLELQVMEYGGGAQDRNIPIVADKLMRLVIWGVQYPNPSADPNREIVSAIWSGTGRVFDVTRAQEGTEAVEHFTGDNIALLFTANMSSEILILEDFENSIVGSIAYTDDTDGDGEMEVLNLPPDDEISEEGYKKVLVSGGVGEPPYWQFVFADEVGASKSVDVIQYEYFLICGGIPDGGYIGWRIDDGGVIQRNLLAGAINTSFSSVVLANGKFFLSGGSTLWKFNKDGTVDTFWQDSGKKEGMFGTAIFDLALDADENLYVVNSRPGVATTGDTIWKLDSAGDVIWSTWPLNYSRSASSIVVASDDYVYVAASKPTGGNRRGMKLNPVNGAVLVNYNYVKADKVAVDNFGFVYLAGGLATYNIWRFSNDAVSYWARAEGTLTLQNILVQSGNSASNTKVFVVGQNPSTSKSVWKFNNDLSTKEVEYNANYSFEISEDTDNNLLIACSPSASGEDGTYQIVKLRASDLSFMLGIRFNDSQLEHVSRQVLVST